MKRSEHRILTTHVGSLSRPADLLASFRARAEGKAEPAHAATLAQAVASVVKRQRETGIDIVNDGEFGKPASRPTTMAVVELRLRAARRLQRAGHDSGVRAKKSSVADLALTSFGNRRDWKRFGEFYQDRIERAHRWRADAPHPPSGLHRADQVQRPGQIAGRHRQPEAGDGRSRRRGRLYDFGRAGQLRARRGPALPDRGRIRRRLRRGDARGIQGDRRRRPHAADRRSEPVRQLGHDQSGAAARRVQEVRSACASRRSTMRCAACRRIASATTSAGAAGTARTPPTFRSADIVDVAAERQRRRLFGRSRQRPPRARVAGLAGRHAAGRKAADSGRRQPRHQRRRASAAGGRPDRQIRQGGRARERHRRRPIAAWAAASIRRSPGPSSRL